MKIIKGLIAIVLNPLLWAVFLVVWLAEYKTILKNWSGDTIQLWLILHAIPVLLLLNVLLLTVRYLAKGQMPYLDPVISDEKIVEVRTKSAISFVSVLLFIISCSLTLGFLFIVFNDIKLGTSNYGVNLFRNFQK
jgi:hypothetical protein